MGRERRYITREDARALWDALTDLQRLSDALVSRMLLGGAYAVKWDDVGEAMLRGQLAGLNICELLEDCNRYRPGLPDAAPVDQGEDS